MTRLSTIISFIFTKSFYHKAFAYGLLLLALYIFKDFALLFLLIFVFAYLFYSSAKFIKAKIDLFVCKKLSDPKKKKKFTKYFNLNLIIILEYVIFLIIFIGIITNAIPKIQSELT
jgi:predicted PurR-regulated permease PerM